MRLLQLVNDMLSTDKKNARWPNFKLVFTYLCLMDSIVYQSENQTAPPPLKLYFSTSPDIQIFIPPAPFLPLFSPLSSLHYLSNFNFPFIFSTSPFSFTFPRAFFPFFIFSLTDIGRYPHPMEAYLALYIYTVCVTWYLKRQSRPFNS